ncbi:MAG: hypothetical protein O3C45_01355 [Bacteroidetes bacterium]|nr:hypothetical protein [Bacteroidota bacterium]
MTRSRAQEAPFVALDDPIVPFLQRMLLEGMAPEAIPDQGPFSLSGAHHWLMDSGSGSGWQLETAQRIKDRLPALATGQEAVTTMLRVGGRLATQDRRDLLRWQDADQLSWQPMLQSTTWLTSGAWTAALGVRIDRYYEVDPDGLDTAHRWLSRAENAYLARDGRHVGFFVGRAARHWGEPGQTALMISENPRPMDHVAFRVGADRIQVRSMLAELDSFTGDGRATGTAGSDSVRSGSIRRFLAAHRLSFRIGPRWQAGLSHATVYSGPSSSWSLKFLNPFNVALWEVDNRPKNDENNGMVGAFVHFRSDRMRGRAEILLDDVDILNNKEPASIAAHASLERRDVAPQLNVAVHATLVSARTYNAEQAAGRYLYLDRGIAVQHSDHVDFGAAVEWLRWPGWIIRPGVDVRVQGQQDMRLPLPNTDDAPFLLDGVTETTVRPYLSIRGLMARGLDVDLDAGWNRISDLGHELGASKSAFTASISATWRLTGHRALP